VTSLLQLDNQIKINFFCCDSLLALSQQLKYLSWLSLLLHHLYSRVIVRKQTARQRGNNGVSLQTACPTFWMNNIFIWGAEVEAFKWIHQKTLSFKIPDINQSQSTYSHSHCLKWLAILQCILFISLEDQQIFFSLNCVLFFSSGIKVKNVTM
jgi:hypothetical protein